MKGHVNRTMIVPTAPRVARFLSAAAVCVVLLGLPGCNSIDTPKVSTQGIIESTGTVEATASLLTTAPTSAEVPTSTAADAANALAADPGPTAPSGIWPAKVAAFAKSFKGPVWYPKAVPAGYKVESLDIVELEPGSGLICDIVYTKGESSIGFTQGSPKTRDYEIESAGKVPWGNETADLVYEDPADKSSPQIIVYLKDGNFAEIYGDASIAELKAMAASMVPVK